MLQQLIVNPAQTLNNEAVISNVEVKFILYPNPAIETIFINTPVIIENIHIYSSNRVLVKKIENYSSNSSIDLSELPSAVYILELSTLEGKSFQKFIKK